MKQIINRCWYSLGLHFAGRAGSHLVSAVSLAGILVMSGYSSRLAAEILAAAVLIRVVYCGTRGPRPVLGGCSVRRNITKVIVDEATISAGLAAAAFVLQWPVTVRVMALFFFVNGAGQWALSWLGRRFLDRFARRGVVSGLLVPKRQVLIIGTGKTAKDTADLILDAPEMGTTVAGFLDYHRKGLWRYRDIPLIGHPDEACRLAANCQVDAIMIAVEAEDLTLTMPLFSVAERMGVPVCLIPDMYQPRVARSRTEQVSGRPVMVYRAVPENELILAVKTLMDKAGALCALVMALPLMLMVALAIKIDSQGPVLFKQLRSGLNGRPFGLLKFRTMCQRAEALKDTLQRLNEMSGPVFKVKDDPRVTRVGRMLRKTSLDELPQLFNVLKGDMSLVGPRPPLPSEVAQYEPWQHRRLSVKPGVTCTWQVSGRNAIDFEDWMKLDLEYIDNWSLWQDAKILAKTIPAVIRADGAS